MPNKTIVAKISTGLLMLVFLAVPQLSYAEWGVGINIGGPGYHHDDHFFYRYHDHPHFGVHIHFLPVGYRTIWVGHARYFYYDGLYYNYVGGDYVLVNPPIGAYVVAIPPDFQLVLINGKTYYTNDGIYYILTRHHGYKVVAEPFVYAQPVTTQDSFPVNIPNNSGGYTTVVIKKSGNGFIGPQGEFYAQFPSVAQLKVMYRR